MSDYQPVALMMGVRVEVHRRKAQSAVRTYSEDMVVVLQ